ncbi:hypothetical protein CYMTET_36208, partial [Cymbomonas tetramitiformis]
MEGEGEEKQSHGAQDEDGGEEETARRDHSDEDEEGRRLRKEKERNSSRRDHSDEDEEKRRLRKEKERESSPGHGRDGDDEERKKMERSASKTQRGALEGLGSDVLKCIRALYDDLQQSGGDDDSKVDAAAFGEALLDDPQLSEELEAACPGETKARLKALVGNLEACQGEKLSWQEMERALSGKNSKEDEEGDSAAEGSVERMAQDGSKLSSGGAQGALYTYNEELGLLMDPRAGGVDASGNQRMKFVEDGAGGQFRRVMDPEEEAALRRGGGLRQMFTLQKMQSFNLRKRRAARRANARAVDSHPGMLLKNFLDKMGRLLGIATLFSQESAAEGCLGSEGAHALGTLLRSG